MKKTKNRPTRLEVPSLAPHGTTLQSANHESTMTVSHDLELDLRANTLALEAKLQENTKLKQEREALIRNLELGVLVTNATGKVTAVNEMAEDLLGQPREHLLGVPLDGIWSECGLPTVPFSSVRYQERFLTGYDQVLPPPRPRGKVAIRIIKDVTILRTIQDQIANQQRLAVMGEMIGTIAHEIRNPLGSIELFASLLGTSIQDDAERQTLAKQIAKVVQSLDHVLSNLLVMARDLSPNIQSVNLETVVHDVTMMAMHAIRERAVSVTETLNTSSRMVRADEPLLKQALLNVLLNAIHASSPHGVIEISSRWASIDSCHQDVARITGGHPPHEAVVLSVRDYGCGIRQEDQERMFDPFFSKRSGGTGLGLAIVRQIMDVHQGWVEWTSAPNQGTTISLWIPQEREG